MAKKHKKSKPHHVDAQMDILNVTGMEPASDIVLRELPNKARITRPLTWKQMGLKPIPA